MNNCCCAELVVDEGQQIELNVESDGGIEVGVAEQFVISGGGNYQDKTVNFTPTESAQSQTVQADVGYDALDEVEVNVAAVSDTYVGSAVPRRSVADLDLTGATFTAPAGYYASDADKTMATGHMSVSATKGTVSNHSVSVTPKAAVDNAGYFGTGNRTGTAVTVSASELVSGTKSITQNGTGIDVTEYAAVDVNVSGQAPTGTKNISITSNGTTTEDVAAYANAQITANVPNSYTASDEGKVVDNGALVSQTSDTVTQNGTVDTTLINSLTVNVSGGGGYSTGEYTPTADSKSFTIDTGIDYDFFVIFPEDGVAGYGKRAVRAAAFEPDYTNYYTRYVFTTNNSGGSIAADSYGGTGYFTKSGTSVLFSASSSYVISGVVYRWCAWKEQT